MEIHHCPTEQMIANFYTKPLQGKQYYNLRQIIMGHSPVVVEKRVENKIELTTYDSTVKPVRRTHSREITSFAYKVSSNLH